jgi:bifunctional UDP-N-acetylglucosamine pyrophosphorylase/glucosamine-1-phosphate N-acetyltransferase
VKIVESKDADATERAVAFSNSGVMCIDGRLIGVTARRHPQRQCEARILPDRCRAPGARRRPQGDRRRRARKPSSWGINSRAELAVAEQALQQRLRAAALAGVASP